MKNLIIHKYNCVNKEIVQTATEIIREINNPRLNKKINFNFFKKDQFFVILKKNENLIGIIRVIKKKLYLGKKN